MIHPVDFDDINFSEDISSAHIFSFRELGCHCWESILAKSSAVVVHDTHVIILGTEVGHLLICVLDEVVFLTWLNVLQVNVNIVISFIGTLLMIKSDSVEEFVDDSVLVFAIMSNVELLNGSKITDHGPATDIMIGDTDVVTFRTGSYNKSDTGPLLNFGQ